MKEPCNFEEFEKNVSFDIIEDKDGQSQVLAIFSMGYAKTFSNEFIKDYPELVKDLTAYELFQLVSRSTA